MAFGDLNPIETGGFQVVQPTRKKQREYSFDTDILPTTLKHEGGYTVDVGGPTNYGITQNTLNAVRALKGLTSVNILDLSPKERDTIYKAQYFEAPKFNHLPSSTSGIMFDFGVNAGPGTASKYLQEIVGAIPDTVIGPKTIDKVKKYVETNGIETLNSKLLDRIQTHYNELIKNNPKKYSTYKKGWTNRVSNLRRTYVSAPEEAQVKAPSLGAKIKKGFQYLSQPVESPYGAGEFVTQKDIGYVGPDKAFAESPVETAPGMGERKPFYEARVWKGLKDIASLAMLATLAKDVVKMLESKSTIDTYNKFSAKFEKILDKITAKTKQPLSQKQMAALEELKTYLWNQEFAKKVSQRVRGSVGIPPTPKGPEEPSEYVKSKMVPPDIKTFSIKAQPEAIIPALAPEGDKIRQFITTVKEAEKTAPEVAQTVDSRYTPITNQDEITKAQFRVNSDYNEALRIAMEDTPPTPESVAIALTLIDKAQLESRWEDARTLIEQTAKRATSAGQSIQALTMYERLTPEGVLRYADSTFKRALASMSKEKVANWERLFKLADTESKRVALAKKFGVPYLSEELMKRLYEMASEIQTMEPGRAKSIKIALMQLEIAKNIPTPILKQIAFGQTLAQLLNPKTIIRNLLGNAGFAGIENLSQSVGTVVDILTSLATKQRTTFLPNLKQEMQAGLKAGAEAAEEAKLGIDLGGGKTKFDLPQGSIFHEGVLGGLEKTLNMVLRVPDRMAYSSAFNAYLNNALKSAKVTEPSLQMLEEAHDYGLWRTFQDDSALAKVFTNIKKALNAGKDFGLGDLVIKYPRTPANIISRGLEISPVNLWRVARELARPLIGQPFNQKKFVDATARTITGSALLFGAGAALASLGIITSEREKNRKVSQFLGEIGLGDYRINVSALKRFVMSGMDPDSARLQPGDVLASYDWFQPNSIGLAMGASSVKGKDWTEAAVDAANTIVEQPMIAGVKRFMSTGDAIAGIAKTLEGVPSSFIPTLLNQVRQLTDNISRNTRGTDFFSSLWNKAVYRIPGLSKTLPSNVTAFGEDKEVYLGGTNNPFNVFLNPAFVTKYKPTPSAEMVVNIWKTTGETGQFPRYVPNYLMIDGKKRDLSPQEQHDLQSYIGNRTGVLYNILANDQKFQLMTDEAKAKRLDAMLQDIYTAGKIEILGYRPKNVSNNVRQILQDINTWWKDDAYRREAPPRALPAIPKSGYKKFSTTP